MFAVALTILVADALLAQRVPLDSRFHWDGTYYLEYARNIGSLLREHQIDRYSFSRILPSTLVHIGLRVFGLGFDDATILGGFVLLNGLAALGALACWVAIAKHLRLSPVQLALGAAAFFLNFCFLKYNSFYPVTTDVTAFLISVGMLYAYLVRATVALLVLSFLGAFCWPILVYIGAILLALPRDAAAAGSDDATLAPARGVGTSTIPVLMVAAAAMSLAVWVHYGLGYRHSGSPALEGLAPVSIALLGAYAAGFSGPLLGVWRDVSQRIRQPRRALWRAVLAAGLLLAVHLVILKLAAKGSRNTPSTFLLGLMATAIKQPGVFLVAHFAFFGPIIVLAALRWPAVAALGRRLGPGYGCVLLVTGAIAVGSESRQLMANIAFLVVPAVAVIELARHRLAFLAVFVLLSVATSRVWVRFDLDALVFKVDAYLQEPWQRFFGAIGYWMVPSTYLANLAALVTATLVLGALLRISIRPKS